MKKIIYTDEPRESGWKFSENVKPLTRKQERALGIPTPGKVRLRKVPKTTRINIRLAEDTLEGLKAQAAEAGIPYQTLAASVLHLVARGKLKLALVQ